MVAGEVLVAGRATTKPSHLVDAGTELAVRAGGRRWVGRAGHKLADAFDQWGPQGLSTSGRRCVDVGSSTGGFTQVLLAQGAAHVVAVDVGHGQLVDELARDPRVEERSGTTIRGLTAEDVGGTADLVVVDLSFISLTLVMRELAGLLGEEGDLVLLVKPQFEVGRGRLNRQGVVTSSDHRRAAVQAVVGSLEEHGLHVHGIRASSVRGTAGNAEYLLWARSEPSDTMSQDLVHGTIGALTTDASGGRP